MLSELVGTLVALGKQTDQVDFHSDELLPHVVFLRHGDELREIAVPPLRRNHSVWDIDDVVQFLADKALAPAPDVFVNRGGFLAYLDGEKRVDVLRLEMRHSDRWDTLTGLTTARAFTPRDAVRFLRFELPDTGTQEIVKALARVDFSRSSTGRNAVEHGKESLGRSVEAAVQQADAVPESFRVRSPVWALPGFDRFVVDVTVGVYIDLVGEKVELRTLPDQISRGVGQAVSGVVAFLREHVPGARVFHGVA